MRKSVAELLTTGSGYLDTYAEPAARELVREFGGRAVFVARAFMAILHNEVRAGAEYGAVILGDQALAGGPSVGPGQVYRKTAIDLGLWSPPEDGTDEREAYAEVAQDAAKCLRWAVVVFASKLDAAGVWEGELSAERIADAVRRYNGGGDQARAYREKAVAFATRTWGGIA